MSDSAPPLIFDPTRQQAKLDRSRMRATSPAFLWRHMATDIADRLIDVSRDFENILLVGPAAQFESEIVGNRNCRITKATFSGVEAATDGNILIENDLLPFEEAKFDLVVCIGMLESLNDLPGFLIQLRRILKPDGLFLGSIFGAGTLSTLKSLMIDAEGDRVGVHIHPQIDLKTIADLIVRAGFALPVVDQDNLAIRYSKLDRLLSDLRDAGLGNALAGPHRYFGKAAYKALLRNWENATDQQGKVSENFSFLQLLGWAPSIDQPKAARRGSAAVSLADVLPSKAK